VQAYKAAKKCKKGLDRRHATVLLWGHGETRNSVTPKTDRREKRRIMQKIKRLINRLVKWLEAHGISPAEIADCIEYITR